MSEQGFPFVREFIKNLNKAKIVSFSDPISINALREIDIGLRMMVKNINEEHIETKEDMQLITNYMPDLCVLGFMTGFMFYHDQFKSEKK